MRFRVPELFLGAFLAVAIFGMGMLFASSFYHPPNQTADKATTSVQKSHKPEPFTVDWLTEDGTVFFTAVLVFVAGIQAALFVWQLIYMGQGMRDAAIAANAAAISADTAIAVEGARLICQPSVTNYWAEIGRWTVMYDKSPDMTLNNRTFTVRFKLRNYGKTPATMQEVNAVVFKSANPPPTIAIRRPQLDLPNETVVDSGGSPEFIVSCRDHFSKLAEAIAIRDGEQYLWLHGRAVYDDVFGREGTHIFLYRLRPREGDGSYIRYWDETTYRPKPKINA